MYEILMIITNIDHHSVSVFKKMDNIDYCDFHLHGKAISIYCPTLHEASCKYELLDAIRAYSSIHKT